MLILPSSQTISMLRREYCVHMTAQTDVHIFFVPYKPLFVAHVLLMEKER